MTWTIFFTKEAQKDAKKIKQSHLKEKIKNLLELLKENPFQDPPPYKKLRGSYTGLYSRRINLQHRLFYKIDEQDKKIKIIRMWTHYGDN